MVTKWITFKNLGKAIGIAQQRGAVVKWYDKISNYRFDATLRLRQETYEYLIVLDCIKSKMPLTIQEVETFTIKSKAVGAHVSILAASSGYSEEATKFAMDNDIRLLTPEAFRQLPVETLADIFRPVFYAHTFKFLWADGTGETALPEEPEILRFFMREMKIAGPSINTVPEKVMNEHHNQTARSVNSTPQVFEISFPEGTTITHPNTRHKKEVKAFTFIYQLISVSHLAMKEGLDDGPYLIGNTLRDELAKRNPSADPSKIESGFDTALERGKYYYNPNFRFSYYCESVKRSKAIMVLVESYQMGKFIQARAELSTNLSNQFIEITEQGEIDRLAKMYERFAISDKNLEERFKIFAKHIDGAECVDDLALTREQEKANKADYFFNDREIICELKALQTDTSDKVAKVLAPYSETPEWPLFFGKQDLQKILNHLPNKDQINTKIIDAITDSIEGIVEKANRQIRATKKTFKLPQASGLLIIVNDLVDLLSPNLVAYRVKKSLNKRTSTGEVRFPNVSVVLIIGGAHYAQLNPDLKGIPILVIPNDVPDSKKAERFVSTLIQKWSAFDAQPLVRMNSEQAIALEFKKFSDDTTEQTGFIATQRY